MSEFLKLNVQDFLKGFVVAAIAAIGTALLPLLDAGTLPSLAQLQAAGIIGITAGLSYLFKNIFTNSNGQIVTPEPPKQ
jgi:hypothetical protein